MEDKSKIVGILDYLWSIVEPKVEYIIARPEWSIPVGLSIVGLIIAYKNYSLNKKKIKNLNNEQNKKTSKSKETKQKEIWELLPNWIQNILARLGWIYVDVTADKTLFYFFSTGEMQRKSSFEGRLHYIRSQEFSAQRMKDHDMRNAIHQNAIWLYSHLMTLSDSYEEKQKVSDLQKESQKNLKDYNNQEYKRRSDKWKKERNDTLILNFKETLKKLNVGYEDKLLIVPEDNSEWLLVVICGMYMGVKRVLEYIGSKKQVSWWNLENQ